jgi:plastocyanin
MTRFALAALVLAACGGENSGGTPIDAAPDTTAAKVQAVTCPNTADATVMTSTTVDAYVPMMTTVPVNAVVKFVMPGDHNVAPNTQTATDPALSVGFGETKCLKFNASGTYGFYCGPHGFTGSIVVQ